MKTSVNVYEFRDAFRAYDRQDQFSHAGLGALFDYLEEYEDSCDTEVELDVIALCCDFAEYDSATEAAGEYGFVPDGDSNILELEEALGDANDKSDEAYFGVVSSLDEERERIEEEALDWLRDRTQVIDGYSGTSVIIQQF